MTETTRGTVLSKNGVKISTVEHGMAALYALGIDNCLIQVNGPEFPILDGSAQYYAQEIERVGTEEQNAVKDFYIIKSKIEFRDEKTGSSIIVLPDENFSLNVLVSYDSTIIPNQFATLEDMSKFRDEVAAAVHSYSYARSNHCCRPVSSKAVIWTMPSLSTNEKCLRKTSISWPM